MTRKINSLSKYRKKVNIPLHDIAHLLNIDISTLSKIERGIRQPNPRTILLYHILFKAPLIELFAEQYDELKVLLKRRSRSLIEQLQIEQPPKSKGRIGYIHKFVNTLNIENYDE